jgi:tryptophanyl-tRNA synthetase
MEFGLLPLDATHSEALSFLPPHLLHLIEYQRGLSEFDPTKPNDYRVYTGRGPSLGSFHIGHLPGIELAKEMQCFLGTKMFFMISDDEKMFRDNIDAITMKENVRNTVEQLAKLGIQDANAEIYINSSGISQEHYAILIRLMSMTSVHVLNNIFGEKSNVGEYFYPLYQILPCFLGKQVIVIAGKDQDPFFRLARDLAKRMGAKPPILLYTKSVPGLDGSGKMSTSVPSSLPIFLTDSAKTIQEKIRKVKKVGAGSLEELFATGANLESDTLYALLRLFESNTDTLYLITKAYTTGLHDTDAMVPRLTDLCGTKGISTRDGKSMITTGGLRVYVATLLTRVVESA